MNNYIKVKGHENLYRDPNTGAISNTEKPARNKLKSHLDSIAEDINSLKEDIR